MSSVQMPYLKRKTRTAETPAEKKENLAKLEKAITDIYLAHSERTLACLIEEDLPQQCGVDRITLTLTSTTPIKLIKKTTKTYIYPCCCNDNNYLISFYKRTGLAKVKKSFLRQVGKALEVRLNQMEQYNSIKNKKEQWELAFDTITAAICLTDLQNRILRTNKTFRHKTQLSKKELLQKNYFSIFFGTDTNEQPPKPGSGKKRFQRTVQLANGNPQQEFFEVLAQKISPAGEYEVQLVILREITEQIQIEKKIAQSAQSAELGIISSSIAHELNNPIGGINSLLQILQMKHKEKDTLADDLKEMSLATQRCLDIIHQLLNVHR